MNDWLQVFGQLFDCLEIVSIILKWRKDERQRKEQHLRLIALLPCVGQRTNSQNFLFVCWKVYRNTSVLKTKLTKVLNTFYQHLDVIPVTLHNAAFLYYCLFFFLFLATNHDLLLITYLHTSIEFRSKLHRLQFRKLTFSFACWNFGSIYIYLVYIIINKIIMYKIFNNKSSCRIFILCIS